MKRFLYRLRKGFMPLTAALALSSGTVGCHSCWLCGHGGHGGFGGGKEGKHRIDNCADVPQGAIPLPAGSYLRAYHARHENKAEMDDFVIYTNEWSYEDDLDLGPWGWAHFGRMLMRLPSSPFAIMIQADPSLELNAKRRSRIIAELESAGIPNPESRVIVLTPQAEGLFGAEAERKLQKAIEQFGAGGGSSVGGGGGGGLGGFGGGGGGYGGFR